MGSSWDLNPKVLGLMDPRFFCLSFLQRCQSVCSAASMAMQRVEILSLCNALVAVITSGALVL